MSDEPSEDLPKTQPDFALIPPWPPKPTAQDLEDNGEPSLIMVSFMERLQLPDKSWSSEPIATFTFDARSARQEDTTLTRPDGSKISVIAGYSPDNGGVLSVLLRQAEDILGALACLGSYRVQSIIWISPQNSLIISVSQRRTS
jgi:hypothetical protein